MPEGSGSGDHWRPLAYQAPVVDPEGPVEPARVAGDRGVQGLPGVGLADPLQGAAGRTDNRQVGGCLL